MFLPLTSLLSWKEPLTGESKMAASQPRAVQALVGKQGYKWPVDLGGRFQGKDALCSTC